MAGASMRNFECTLATTTSSSASRSSSWSSEPSSRMSTSIPVRMRKGARSSFNSASTSSWERSRSALSPCATVRRALWSVRTRYSCPRSRAASAISRIGLPPSDQSECEWQSPRSELQEFLRRPVERDVVGRLLQLGQALGHLAVQRLGDDLRRRLPDAFNCLQPPGRGERAQRVGVEVGHGPCRVAKGAHLVGVGPAALEEEGDAVEGVERLHGSGLLGPARGHPRRLVGHLRVLGRPRCVVQAGLLVAGGKGQAGARSTAARRRCRPRGRRAAAPARARCVW